MPASPAPRAGTLTALRVVVVTRVPPVLLGFHATIVELGHEPVALLTLGGESPFGAELLASVPPGLDVLMPGRRASIAPLLAAVRPDLVVCMGFPWKVPADALAVPPLGWLNGHPSLLPRHRGPVPVAWAIRNGDEELGVTFHFMDAELDTGPVVAQRVHPLGEFAEPDEFYARMGVVVVETLREALEKIAAGDRGTPQPEGGEYETFFTEDDVHLDLSRPAREVHRLVWAWHFTIPHGTERGALLELDGETVRVLRSSLEEVEGARRVECADAPLWLVSTEPVPPASPPSA
ncbi:MAG TPA: formyltransferase family protein [Gaiellaceae bacterium]|nr:formyltransferase family protein [Gaiellaceae bacterium]